MTQRQPAPSIGPSAAIDRAQRQPAQDGRLTWRIDTAGGSHILDVHPSPVSSIVSMTVDGRMVGRTGKPTMVEPWSSLTFTVDGHEITVALTPGSLVMNVEVFRDGASLVDGRSLGEARSLAPRARSRYEQWTHTNITGVSSSAIAPPLVVALSLSAIAAILVALMLLRTGAVAGILIFVGGFVLQILFVRGWFIATARVHRYLVGRHGLADLVRLGLIAAAFVAIPVGAAIAILSIILLSRSL